MTYPNAPEPLEHGSTVLPGVPLPGGIHPQPSEPTTPTSAPAEAPAEAVEAPADRPPKTPWWKKELGGSKKAAAVATTPAEDIPRVTAAPAGPALPLPPPSAPPVSVENAPELVESSASTPDETESAVPTTAALAHGRHAAAPAPAASGGRRRLLLLALLGLLLVLAAVAAFVWPGFLAPAEEESAAPRPTPSPTTASVALVVPATLAGLRRFTGAANSALAASVEKGAVEGLTDPVSAVYGTGTTPSVQVIAWHAVSPPAKDTVTAAFTGFEGSTGAKVTAVREVSAPGLDGQMECGLATVKKADTLQCFWADAFSFGSVTVLDPKDRAAATRTATEVRVAVEQKA